MVDYMKEVVNKSFSKQSNKINFIRYIEYLKKFDKDKVEMILEALYNKSIIYNNLLVSKGVINSFIKELPDESKRYYRIKKAEQFIYKNGKN